MAQPLKFDVIVGNPPYQGSAGNGSQSLWPKFINLDLQLLQEQGQLLQVTPASWLGNLHSSNWRHMLTRNIQQVQPCAEHFPGVGSTFCWWQLRNEPSTGSTRVGPCTTVDLSQLPMLPVRQQEWPLVQRLLTTLGQRLPWHKGPQPGWGTRAESRQPSALYPWRVVRRGSEIVWVGGAEPPHHQVPKVVLAVSRADIQPTYYPDPITAFPGTMAWTPMPDAEQAHRLIQLLNHPVYRYLLAAHKYLGWQPVAVFRYVPVWLDRDLTSEQVWDQFGVSDQERSHIMAYRA